MFADPVRERFTSMVRLPDEDIDLAAACFLIAQEEDPEVSVLAGVRRIDAITEPLMAVIDEDTPFFHAVHAINYRLFDCEGFEGDTEEYDDPQNALLHRVLSRRRGLPITLSILYMEVGRRLGLDIEGIAFPGHFLVRIKDEWGECFVDPFHKGRIRLRSQLEKRLAGTMSAGQAQRPEHFEPASARRILVRLLSNLKCMCLRKSEIEAALRASERIVILLPDHLEERRDRGLLYRQTGHAEAAIADLREYLDAAPHAPDAPRVRRVLVQLLSSRTARG
jgi:regulator of sirC expression with transglutaminase-like and TPR domain